MSARKLFGTDGIRGVANVYPMTAEVAVRLGKAIAVHFRNENSRTKILIGKDTRVSGYMFESALAAGITSMGADVQLVGPLPTPAIAFLTTGMRANAGIVISASHNAYHDNGIKIFGSDGFKLPDASELAIEATVLADEPPPIDSDRIGKAIRIDDAGGRYLEFLKHTFPRELNLEGLRIVLDCANGAAYKVAPWVFKELGAEVIKMGVHPDGFNINQECGSLYPDAVARKVKETRADIGICLDGDADRLILIDEKGNIVDGDKIIGLCAISLKNRGLLKNNTVVTTVMSNLGLEIAMQNQGIKLIRSAVGDRHVVSQMRKGNYSLGGEQSGHIVFADHSTTGDGTLAALQVLAIQRRAQKPLSEIAKVITALPQILVNVMVTEKPPIDSIPGFSEELALVIEELGDRGRVLVRYSGTESKARVMIEGPDEKTIAGCAARLSDKLRASIGA